MPLKQQYVNAIVLSASGDALGWMTEFYSDSKQLAKKFGTSQITKFLNWERFCGNRYNGYKDIISSGSYSDDTQLMLAVARSINIEGKCDHQHFAKIELVGWLDYKRGAGMATTEAAQKIQRKSASWNNNFYIKKQNNIIINYSNAGGNGAAMRVLPISLAFIHNLELTLEEIFCNSIVTHGHPRAIIGAMLYGLIINTIINLKLNGIELLIYIGQNMQAVLLRVLDNILRRGVLTSWFKIWEQNGKNFDSEYGCFHPTPQKCKILKPSFLQT
jgi:ADP-ribosylglycohydrolase